jgi:PKD repeat protein
VEVGSGSRTVTAFADGASGDQADFDWGDGSAVASVPVPAPPGVASTGHTYAADGTYTVTVSSGGASDTEDVTVPGAAVDFDPAEHTVTEVQDYVSANPGQAQAVRDAEAAGKNRSTLLSWLDGVIAG